ncbi:hypothetical protein PLICRDRAFT_39980 [Plicaturopsis crispa FD-325 SS-3]|nr:hypothetical protein PLICRDRAFT_39980 [Plicaturopsis crispa FD-325 SS-3]
MSFVQRQRHSFGDISLVEAVIQGDEERVRAAIDAGADVNALDHDGRSVISCAITGENWEEIDASFLCTTRLNILRTLLAHRKISLYSLNAPQLAMRGVTPLGVAAWLNSPEAVQLLLEASSGAVSVDGMDAQGATALMYAARDGNLEVIEKLLAHGARPDFRDVHHRTSIQFALAHPQALWACEMALRRHRWQESQSRNKRNLCFSDVSEQSHIRQLMSSSLAHPEPYHPPSTSFFDDATTTTNALINATLASDLSIICNILYAPRTDSSSSPCPPSSLVNLPDMGGWSPVHYCASAPCPSVEVLDLLYRAGADVSLFTALEDYTPLHCLARTARACPDDQDAALSVYLFAVHLIRDLRAPLSAQDKNQETCIHVAAEHGVCIDVLSAFVDCDVTGSVRSMRNSRGLTALEVAKPEFLAVFDPEGEHSRPRSVASTRTVRPQVSLASMSSLMEWAPSPSSPSSSGQSSPVPDVFFGPAFDVSISIERLLDNLRLTSPQTYHDDDPAHLDYLSNLILDAAHINDVVVSHFREKTSKVMDKLHDVRETFTKVDERLDIVAQAVRDKLGAPESSREDTSPLEYAPGHVRRLTRDSKDSQVTAVSNVSGEAVRKTTPDSEVAVASTDDTTHRDVAIQTGPTYRRASSSQRRREYLAPLLSPDPLRDDVFDPASTIDDIIAETEASSPILRSRFSFDLDEAERPTDAKLQGLIKKRKKEEKRERELDGAKRAWLGRERRRSGTERLKAWLWKKISHTPELPMHLEIVQDLDSDCGVGREVKLSAVDQTYPGDMSASSIEKALHSSHIVLAAAGRDLASIEDCMTTANQYISAASHSISRVDRLVQKSLATRKMTIGLLRVPGATIPEDSSVDDIYVPVPASPVSSRSSSVSDYFSPSSASSRPTTVASMNYTMASASSSNVSVSSTLADGDDEDTRALRRLLQRKIESRIDGALAEIDKAAVWLRIVKEAIRGVTKRTCL